MLMFKLRLASEKRVCLGDALIGEKPQNSGIPRRRRPSRGWLGPSVGSGAFGPRTSTRTTTRWFARIIGDSSDLVSDCVKDLSQSSRNLNFKGSCMRGAAVSWTSPLKLRKRRNLFKYAARPHRFYGYSNAGERLNGQHFKTGFGSFVEQRSKNRGRDFKATELERENCDDRIFGGSSHPLMIPDFNLSMGWY